MPMLCEEQSGLVRHVRVEEMGSRAMYFGTLGMEYGV